LLIPGSKKTIHVAGVVGVVVEEDERYSREEGVLEDGPCYATNCRLYDMAIDVTGRSFQGSLV
jgi:hypothetical protein